MIHKLANARTLSLLAVGGICCLAAGNAEAQRGGAGRASGVRASIASIATGSGTSGTTNSSASSNCPSSSSSTSSTTGTTTTGTTTTGTTSSIASLSRSTSTQAQLTALSASAVSAVRTANNVLSIRYNGSTAGVKTVYVAVLDANQRALQQQAITQSPVQANLSLSSTARYYGVQVVYANGVTKQMIATIK